MACTCIETLDGWFRAVCDECAGVEQQQQRHRIDDSPPPFSVDRLEAESRRLGPAVESEGWRVVSGGPECNHTTWQCKQCGTLSDDIHEHEGGYRRCEIAARREHRCE